MIAIRVTRYFVNEDGVDAELSAGFCCLPEDASGAVDAAIATITETVRQMPLDLGTFREMTDDEAVEYVKQQDEQQED